MPARPHLRYLELHLAEHCNLSCRRCGHFSPLAPASFAEPDRVERDLERLAQHFENIGTLRLMGGEPLLHPTPQRFATIARRVFPNTNLRLVTNGLLLKKMPDAFWDDCRRARLVLDVSVYPLLEKSLPDVLRLCAEREVAVATTRTNSFFSWVNPRGDSEPTEAFAYCRKHYDCPLLHDSRLYVCSMPTTIGYYNRHFDRAIPSDDGIDIFAPDIDGATILARLETPIATCRFCSCHYVTHPWESSPVRAHDASDVAAVEE
jgi:hypothetical protein